MVKLWKICLENKILLRLATDLPKKPNIGRISDFWPCLSIHYPCHKRKMSFSSSANSQYFFAKISIWGCLPKMLKPKFQITLCCISLSRCYFGLETKVIIKILTHPGYTRDYVWFSWGWSKKKYIFFQYGQLKKVF
jgi:hypothetical protein